MKAKSLALLPLLLLGNLLQAQYSIQGKAGFTLSRLTKEYTDAVTADNQRARAGVQAGAVVERRITDRFLLQGELLYTQKGHINLNVTRSAGVGLPNGVWLESGSSLRLSYVELPLLVKYEASRNFFITAGPSLAYLFHAQQRASNNSWNVTKAYEKVDLGLNGDLSYKAADLTVGTRYTYGLNKKNFRKVEDDPEFPAGQDFVLYGRNQVLQFYLTYPISRL